MKTIVTSGLRLAALLLFVCSFVVSITMQAADSNPPERLTYQGYLVDGNGLALATNAPKNFDVIFRIYDSQSGGTLKWSEQQTVTVDKGYFSVLLGEGSQVGSESHAALSLTFKGIDASDRFVGLTVKGIGVANADVDILPRLRMLTSPYTFLARNAVNAAALANSTNGQIVSVAGSLVGINKSIPTVALDVVGAGTFTGNLIGNNAFIGDVGHGVNWAGFSHKDSANTAGYALLQNNTGLNTLINAKNGSGSDIEFKFDNVMAANITPGGNMTLNGGLGVGTPTPGSIGQVAVGGTASGYIFNDRLNSATFGNWIWYAYNGSARLYSSVGATDRLVLENSGKIGIPGANSMEFGYGVSGKEGNAGKIGYGTFTTDTLDIIGAGPASTAQRKIKLWAEGGLTINGDVNQNGAGAFRGSLGYYINDRTSGPQWAFYAQDGSARIWNQNYGDRLILGQTGYNNINGYLGINNGSPICPLDVRGYANLNWPGGYGYLNYNGASYAHSSITATYGIYCDYRVAAAEFNAISDSRVKEVVGRSDVQKDLEIIQKLRVTDYRPVDKVLEGNKLKKGFIAQEVEAVIPEAVTSATNFIPNVYALATNVVYDAAQKTLTVAIAKAHALKIGDRVKLLTEQSALELTVTKVPTPQKFVVENCEKAVKQVFVFGKQVSDFRTLNYDRIFTTGIGAIQELAKEVMELKSQQSRIAALEKKAAKVDDLEKQLSQLKETVATLAKALPGKQAAVAPAAAPTVAISSAP